MPTLFPGYGSFSLHPGDFTTTTFLVEDSSVDGPDLRIRDAYRSHINVTEEDADPARHEDGHQDIRQDFHLIRISYVHTTIGRVSCLAPLLDTRESHRKEKGFYRKPFFT